MRREGYELSVSTPRVLFKEIDGVRCEPIERLLIDRWLTEFLRRFFISQFKRSCIPDSPKVGSVSLSPRGDWRMPSDAAMQAFLQPDERI